MGGQGQKLNSPLLVCGFKWKNMLDSTGKLLRATRLFVVQGDFELARLLVTLLCQFNPPQFKVEIVNRNWICNGTAPVP